jgi:hypothetical protein
MIRRINFVLWTIYAIIVSARSAPFASSSRVRKDELKTVKVLKTTQKLSKHTATPSISIKNVHLSHKKSLKQSSKKKAKCQSKKNSKKSKKSKKSGRELYSKKPSLKSGGKGYSKKSSKIILTDNCAANTKVIDSHISFFMVKMAEHTDFSCLDTVLGSFYFQSELSQTYLHSKSCSY